jgi:hypothetical protein
MYGDSITHGVEVIKGMRPDMKKEWQWVDARGGIAGDTIEGLTARFNRMAPNTSRNSVVILIGTNNTQAPPNGASIGAMLDAARKSHPGAKIFINNVLPRTDRSVVAMNSALRREASARKLPFLTCGNTLNPKTFPDGLHLTLQAYQLLLKCIKNIVLTNMNPTPAPKPNPAPKPGGSKPNPAPKPEQSKRPKYPRKKYTGIFVSTWHDNNSIREGRVMGKVARYEKNLFHWWGEPKWGIKGYTWNNNAMIDYHVDNWVKLGVDFIFLDLTNGTQPEIVAGAQKLCARMAATGRGPRVVLWIRESKDAQMVWNNFYGKYPKDLFFEYLGKPLLLIAGLGGNSQIPSGGILDRFTVRLMWGLGTNSKMWSFKETNTDPKPFMYNGKAEQLGLAFATQQTYMTTPAGRRGRENGKFFQEQISNARKYNPTFITITGYNEWTAQNQADSGKPPVFTDLWGQEFSHDIEPMAGGHGDKYFKMAQEFIRSWSPGAY